MIILIENEHSTQVINDYRANDFDLERRLALAYDAAAAPCGDTTARLYAARCEALLASPPPRGWEPVHILTEK